MPGRLPVPLTAIGGRGTLATELTDLASTQRLVTLVGPGGVGKTRLLLEVGHRLQADRVDRAVVFCELAAADDATATAVVAQALGFDARPDRQSVVAGKSVSVRVDLGGRRTIKKKVTTPKNTYKQ